MNKIFKIFACAVAASIVLLSCEDTSANNAEQDNSALSSSSIQSSSSLEGLSEMPVMDSRVMSYSRKGFSECGQPTDDVRYKSFDGAGVYIDACIFNDGQAECNYFTISFTRSQSILEYWILSQDMVIYQIKPGNEFIGGPTVPSMEVMLVCDDTVEGNLKDRIDLDSIRAYKIPNWDSENGIGGPNWENVFFKINPRKHPSSEFADKPTEVIQ